VEVGVEQHTTATVLCQHPEVLVVEVAQLKRTVDQIILAHTTEMELVADLLLTPVQVATNIIMAAMAETTPVVVVVAPMETQAQADLA
jgi:hypothetical protein